MSTDREVTRIVRSWLEEGVTTLPDRVLDAVLDQLPATPQRRAWRPARRFQLMNTSFRIASAAVAVVVLAVVGAYFLPRMNGVGGAATPPPTATASPSPTPVPFLPSSGAIPPGTYRSDFLVFTLPSGWTGWQAWAALKNNSDPPNGMALAPWRIAGVYPDPCRRGSTVPTVGPTVADLVAALLAQRRSGPPPTPVDVTLAGYRGKEVELVVPADVTFSACDGGEYRSWTATDGGARYNQGPGQHDVLDILDVNGQTLVVNRAFFPATSAADLAELRAVLDSARILP